MAQDMQLPLLGEVPLNADICTLSDAGKPIVVSQPDSPNANHYREIARNILNQLDNKK
jgi:ATP-binding protein involved in chromosome partitioning